MKKYLRIWLNASTLSAQSNLDQRFGALMFIVGKFIRFGFFLILILLIGEKVQQVSGYSTKELITFFLFFNFFDITGQLLFRGIYGFRNQIVSGEFDFSLAKPISPLFQALTRETDILDLPLLIVVVVALFKQSSAMSFSQLYVFLILAICGLVIITGIHIIVAALGIITTEVDHTIMIYRDLSAMARFPTDIYTPSIRTLITFIIPIGIAFTVPAKAFLGILNPIFFIYSFIVAIVFFYFSLQFWKYALTKYSSASS